MDKPKHHQVPVVRINEVKKHPNADTLGIVEIDGYQAIVKLSDYKAGDPAYYVPPDNVVPEKAEYAFLWRSAVLPDGSLRDGMRSVPVRYRRIRARKFRGEWSEGLLMPLPDKFQSVKDLIDPDIMYTHSNKELVVEGEDLSDKLGIVHYEPPDPEDLLGNERGPRRPKSLKGWMFFLWYKFISLFGFEDPYSKYRGGNEKGPNKPHYDIENLKNYNGIFQDGDIVQVTEKIHGCQGRYVWQDNHMYAGSRNWWKHPNSGCVWRKTLEQNPWIEDWCKAHEGYTLYGEIVPVQGEKFMYGCRTGEYKFLVFDILKPDGIDPRDQWVGWDEMNSIDSLPTDDHWVPVLYIGSFDLDSIKKHAEEKSKLNGIREGVVVKPVKEQHVRGLGRAILKVIANTYLEKS